MSDEEVQDSFMSLQSDILHASRESLEPDVEVRPP